MLANEAKGPRFPAKPTSAAIPGAADAKTHAGPMRSWVGGKLRMKFETITTNSPGYG
jgi:hypothetical protein